MSKVGEETILSVFKYYDADNSGKISVKELKKVMDQMGIVLGLEQIKLAIAQYDFDQDGEWDFGEFYEFYIKVVVNTQQNISIDQEIQGVFNLLDADRNGKIDVQEIKVFFQQVGYPLNDNEIAQLIQMYDTNKSGLMEYDEFANFYKDAKSRF